MAFTTEVRELMIQYDPILKWPNACQIQDWNFWHFKGPSKRKLTVPN